MNIRTVAELIDALQHFPPEAQVEIVYETYAHRDIDCVVKDEYSSTVRIIAKD